MLNQQTGVEWKKSVAAIILIVAGSLFSIQGQVANNDYYTVAAGTVLSVAAPGVLANDAGNGSLTATLVTQPANGTLVLNTNGSFVYTPTNNFTGTDGFTYTTSNGSQTSSVATVAIMILSPGEFFQDNFYRPANGGTIFPWVAYADGLQVLGTWVVSNQWLDGTSPAYSYGDVYFENAGWTNYAVRAQIRFSTTNAASAGIMGQLNPVTGSHYSAWIYPEGSTEQYSPHNGTAVLLLIKYEGWTNYTVMGNSVPLPGVGTNWNTLGLSFQSNQVSAYYNGTLVASATDNGAIDGMPAYTNGGVGLSLWTIPPNTYTLSVSNLVVGTNGYVANASIANNAVYTVTNNSSLQVSAPGILAGDSGNGPLTALLVSGPASGNLSLGTNGGFTYTPTNSFTGMDNFTYVCTDGQTTSGVATVAISVTPPSGIFYDSFARPTNAGSIFPWTLEETTPVPANIPAPSGVWAITNNSLVGASYSLYTYTIAYTGNASWSNYSVQAQFQISSTNAIGSGLGGRLNPATGARYSVWIYPENSPETISPGQASLAIYKYENWTAYTVGNFMPLPGMGTNLHTVKIFYEGNQILAYYDGVLVTNWTDNGAFDGRPAFTNGDIDVETYKNPIPYTTTVKNVTVNALNAPPMAVNNTYIDSSNTTFNVSSPGILANDTGGNAPLSALLVTGTTYGSLTFSNNGGFSYTPAANFTGFDSFTYQCTDGQSTSSVATVEISVTPTSGYFYDNFARPPDSSSSILPWVNELGAWNMTNGQMIGSSSFNNYGYAYYANAGWTNYSVQAQIQFSSTNAWGGGIGGRLNPATGAHYAAWVYPEGSPDGTVTGLPAGTASLQLIKFETWNTYTLLGRPAALPGVGTNWHNLKLAFRGTNIMASFDGNRISSVVDNGSVDGQAAYTNGGVSLDLWTASPTAFTMSVSNVAVNPIVYNNRFNDQENQPLVVGTPGVLSNDTDVYGTNLVAALVAGPTNGTVNLNTNGAFTYKPATNFVGTDSFTVQATDSQNLLGTAQILITVAPAVVATPAPVILSIGVTNNMAAITWSSVTNKSYRLQYVSTLTSTNWTDVSPDVAATGSNAIQTNSLVGASQRFYRILLLTP